MKKIEHHIEGKLVVHYDNPLGDSYALCGQDIAGDENWTTAVTSNKRVNCEHCIMVRDHVLGRKNEK